MIKSNFCLFIATIIAILSLVKHYFCAEAWNVPWTLVSDLELHFSRLCADVSVRLSANLATVQTWFLDILGLTLWL